MGFAEELCLSLPQVEMCLSLPQVEMCLSLPQGYWGLLKRLVSRTYYAASLLQVVAQRALPVVLEHDAPPSLRVVALVVAVYRISTRKPKGQAAAAVMPVVLGQVMPVVLGQVMPVVGCISLSERVSRHATRGSEWQATA